MRANDDGSVTTQNGTEPDCFPAPRPIGGPGDLARPGGVGSQVGRPFGCPVAVGCGETGLPVGVADGVTAMDGAGVGDCATAVLTGAVTEGATGFDGDGGTRPARCEEGVRAGWITGRT